MTIETPARPASRATRLEIALSRALQPVRLEIVDESARHAGHAGARAEGETHYAVTIVSDRFKDLSRVERSRVVHEILADEFANGLHALSLSLRSPGDRTS
jgi:BolA protein